MKLKYIIKTIILLLIAAFLIYVVTFTLLPYDHESVEDGEKVEYSVRMWKEFYKAKRNEIEIINMGSSHCNCTFIPTIMSKELEVDCLNLSTSGATIENIYFQFKEMLKSQNPKIVTIELFTFREPELAYSKFGFEGMRLSLNKIQAINYCIESDRMQDYYFPIVTNRMNWRNNNIKERIRRTLEHDTSFEYSGYLPMRYHIENPIEGATWANEQEYADYKDIKSLSQEQLRLVGEIVELANKNDIQLIFVSAPYDVKDRYITQYTWMNSLKDICEQNDIPIINYNENEKLKELGIDQFDLAEDHEHMNLNGAPKVTYDFTNYIKDNYADLLKDETWHYKEKDLENYDNLIKDGQEFSRTAERIYYREQLEFYSYPSAMAEYINYLSDENYVSFIAAKNLDGSNISDNIINSLKSLGLKADFNNKDIMSYIAVIDGENSGNNVELSGVDEIILENDEQGIKAVNLPFEAHIESGRNDAKILIDGFGINGKDLDYDRMNDNKDHSLNEQGFNILVYDRTLNSFVHAVNFDTNKVLQHYYDRNSAEEKYADNACSTNTEQITELKDAKKVDNGLLLNVLGEYPKFSVKDKLDCGHIVFKADINSNCNTTLLLMFNGIYEKYQLINGNNEVYIEVNSNENIKDLLLSFEGEEGEFLITDMQICCLDK